MGLTRARKRAKLSFAVNRRIHGLWSSTVPSRFIDELPPGSVDVIDAPVARGLHDVFLVLDGPRARALAASGAFGEDRGQGLQPVLHRVTDVDAIQAILRDSTKRSYPHAA